MLDLVFTVYILKCADGSYYVGHTDNIEERMQQHQSMNSGYVASRRPVKLVFQQHFDSRADALILEQKIKVWSRNKKEALIAGDFEAISRLSKKKFRRV